MYQKCIRSVYISDVSVLYHDIVIDGNNYFN